MHTICHMQNIYYVSVTITMTIRISTLANKWNYCPTSLSLLVGLLFSNFYLGAWICFGWLKSTLSRTNTYFLNQQKVLKKKKKIGGREGWGEKSLQTCMSRILTSLDWLLASIATYLDIQINEENIKLKWKADLPCEQIQTESKLIAYSISWCNKQVQI
jgi:hypothetical protein